LSDEKNNINDLLNSCLIFEPPKKLNSFYYRCEKKFELDLIIDMYEDGSKFGVVLVSGDELQIYLITINLNKENRNYETKLLKTRKFELPNDHGHGGQSQKRFERNTEIMRKYYVKELSNDIVNAYCYDNHSKSLISKLILAGNGQMKYDISQSDVFKQHLSKYLFKIVNVNEFESNTAKNILIDIIQEIEHTDLSSINMEIDELVRTNSDLLIFGENECLSNLFEHKIKKIYINIDCIDNKLKDKLLEFKKQKKNISIILTKADRLKTYGNWLGVKWFNDEN